MSMQTYGILITLLMFTATGLTLYAAHRIGQKKYSKS
jgi:Na+-driven multidrug efflux pump